MGLEVEGVLEWRRGEEKERYEERNREAQRTVCRVID